MVAKERRQTSWNTGNSIVTVKSNNFFTLDEHEKEVEAMKNASENKNKIDSIILATSIEPTSNLKQAILEILSR